MNVTPAPKSLFRRKRILIELLCYFLKRLTESEAQEVQELRDVFSDIQCSFTNLL